MYKIFEDVEYKTLKEGKSFVIKGIEYDSRKIEKDFVFVAMTGSAVDGHERRRNLGAPGREKQPAGKRQADGRGVDKQPRGCRCVHIGQLHPRPHGGQRHQAIRPHHQTQSHEDQHHA